MDTRGEVYIDGSSVGSEVIRRQIYKGMKGNFSVVEKRIMPLSNFQAFSFSDVGLGGLGELSVHIIFQLLTNIKSTDAPSSTSHLGDIQIVIDLIGKLLIPFVF